VIESLDPISLPLYAILLYAAAMYPIGAMLGSPCSSCCGCANCTGDDCCGSDWARPAGVCCEGRWRTEAGTCCKVDVSAVGFVSRYGDEALFSGGATARVVRLGPPGSGNLILELLSGGQGYARVVEGVVQFATIEVRGAGQSSLSPDWIEVTDDDINDDPESPDFGKITGIAWVSPEPSDGNPNNWAWYPEEYLVPPDKEGECCNGIWYWPESEGECCDNQWQTEDGTCCAVPTVQLEFTSDFGDLASGKAILTEGKTVIDAILRTGGSGYARVVDGEVEVATVTVTVVADGGTPPTISATIDDDPESETFGQITELTIDAPGDGYGQWDTELQEHFFLDTEEGTCCANDWRTGEGTCCGKIWYPAGDECPEGQVFVNKSETCCGCWNDETWNPVTQEFVPTLDNLELIECTLCDLDSFPYSRFDEFGNDRGPIGRCCGDGGLCTYTFEADCDGTWEEQCCEDEPLCEVACCREDDDGVASCEVVPKNECGLPDIIDAGEADCETACWGACCIDGAAIVEDDEVVLMTQAECDENDGCWAGAGRETCRVTDECRPPFSTNCCESVISSASGLTFTQPRRKRCEPTTRPWLVTVTGTTDSEIMIHGVSVGQTDTPTKRCPINVAFLICWDKFNIEPMPCDSSFRRLDVTVCWTPADTSSANYQEVLNYSGCNDITLWLSDCSRNCETKLTYDGSGVISNATFQLRGDATIEANGGALVLPGFSYSAGCNITLTLSGTSTAANAVGAMANPSLSFTQSLKKTGVGRWKLTAASTFTGKTELLAGTLIVAANAPIDGNGAFGYSLEGGLGGGSSPVVELAGGASLLLDGGAQVGRLIEISGGSGRATLGGANTSGTTRFQSVMTFFLNQDVLIQAASGGTVEFANGWLGGNAGDAGSVERNFTFGSGGNIGVVLLSGNPSTSGAARVEYGTLRVTGSLTAEAGVTIDGSSAVLDYRGTVDLASPVSLVQGTLTGDGTINTVAATGGTIRVDSGDQLLIDAGFSGSGTVAKTGAGALVITGDGTFAGTLNVTAGTLTVDNGSTFAGTLNVSGGTLMGGTTVGSVAISNSPTVLVGSGSEIEIGGTLSGSGTLAKAGDGTLRIASTNTFSGTLNVSAGTVVTETIPTNPGGLATTATFTNTTLSVEFTADPTTGAQYVLLAGPTTQTYTPTLTGTAKTGVYNSSTSTLTID
jgi:autotransporter-associated beta strand protein